MKKRIELDLLKHNGELVLVLRFQYDRRLIELVKQLPSVCWSVRLKAWYLPYSEEIHKQVLEQLGGMVDVEDSLLLQKIRTQKKHILVRQEISLPTETLMKLETFKTWMLSKRYSQSTIQTYLDALRIFFTFHSTKIIAEIGNNDLLEFNNEYILKKCLSSSYQNQVVNAIKLFFRTVQQTNMEIGMIERPRRAFVLPNVLSKEEIKLVLTSLPNIKHRAMLSLIYSCGLRRSELLNLRLTDIDSKRNLILVRQSKGKKDRIVPLSPKILELLRSYFLVYKPTYWLFEGQNKKDRYDARSLASVLKLAVKRSKIDKPVTLHWLRHSYATHLLENGTDLRYIQEILGHSRSTTTEIYTHVSNKSIQKIVSPFDSL